MKREIISFYSYGTIAISAFMAPFLTLVELKFWPTTIWVYAVIFAMMGAIWLETEKEKAPEERQLNQGQRKLYNFNLSKGWGKVND